MNFSKLFELVFILAGVVSILHGVFVMARWFLDDRAPKPSPAAPPKTKPYRVTIEADDGWPLRSYQLLPEAAARLVRDLDRDKTP